MPLTASAPATTLQMRLEPLIRVTHSIKRTGGRGAESSSVAHQTTIQGTRLGRDAFLRRKSITKFRCEMKRLAMVLALAGACVLGGSIGSTPAFGVANYQDPKETSDAGC